LTPDARCVMLSAIMRTTLEIDDEILEAARGIASTRHQSLGRTISDLARKGLSPEPVHLAYRNGFPIIKKRRGVAVTNEFIDQLREKEGI
jgi:hypothetical protein